MNKLKTLKDIYVRGQLSRDNLKEEAIKWVKILRGSRNPIDEVTWMTFFNLTEEDLK